MAILNFSFRSALLGCSCGKYLTARSLLYNFFITVVGFYLFLYKFTAYNNARSLGTEVVQQWFSRCSAVVQQRVLFQLLIFATHDTNLLNLAYLRRDYIWFTEKDKTESSDFYSLVEFKDDSGTKIRNDRSVQKIISIDVM
jgi:hypothetical protein